MNHEKDEGNRKEKNNNQQVGKSDDPCRLLLLTDGSTSYRHLLITALHMNHDTSPIYIVLVQIQDGS